MEEQNLNQEPIQASNPAIQQPPTPQNKNLLNNRWLKYLIIAVVLLIVVIGVFLLGKSSTKSYTQQVTSTPRVVQKNVVTKSPSPSPSPELATYANLAGFSIIYGKTNNSTSSSCSNGKPTDGTASLKVFEDSSSNTIYIGKDVEVESPTPSTCNVVPNSLSLIKNGWDNGNPPPDNISYPEAIKYQYKHISSDADLVSLSQSRYGNGCSTIQKTPIPNQSGVYSIRISDKNGSNSMDGGCVTNFIYDFFYSSQNNIAVIGNDRQNCDYSSLLNTLHIPSAVGYGCEAQITFP